MHRNTKANITNMCCIPKSHPPQIDPISVIDCHQATPMTATLRSSKHILRDHNAKLISQGINSDE